MCDMNCVPPSDENSSGDPYEVKRDLHEDIRLLAVLLPGLK